MLAEAVLPQTLTKQEERERRSLQKKQLHYIAVKCEKGYVRMNHNYPNIDMKKTGNLLKKKIEQAGYSVKEIQEQLMLSCPQPIYRWFHGTVLPSVDHLYVLSRLLKVHMDDLLVLQMPFAIIQELEIPLFMEKRLAAYWEQLFTAA